MKRDPFGPHRRGPEIPGQIPLLEPEYLTQGFSDLKPENPRPVTTLR